MIRIKTNNSNAITLDTSPGAIYSGKLKQDAEDIVNDMISLYATATTTTKIQISTRVYEIAPDFVRYYSINGQRKHHYPTSWDNLYKFLTKPVKGGRTIKII